jgi:mono/diheme cytochrome c family protein
VLLALSTGHTIGLGVVAATFIVFALLCSFFFPRNNPNFPGKRLGLFIGVVVLFMIAQLAAVERFAAESKAAEPTSTTSNPPKTTTVAPPPAGDATAGIAVFKANGCNACHTLKEAAATGAVGPNLDTSLSDKDAAFIKTSIIDPNAFIAPGYPKGVMPPNFGTVLKPAQIDDLVALLYKSSHQ